LFEQPKWLEMTLDRILSVDDQEPLSKIKSDKVKDLRLTTMIFSFKSKYYMKIILKPFLCNYQIILNKIVTIILTL
jgi:hypothetical protein